jgi:hypothetical protein
MALLLNKSRVEDLESASDSFVNNSEGSQV